MKRNIEWNLYFRDVGHEDEKVCAYTLESGEDLENFLNLFVDLSDFGFNCFIQCEVWYSKEEEE